MTNTEVAGILDNDIAVQELEQVSGQEIASLRRSQRPAAVRSALETYARNTEAAQNMTRPLQTNEYSGVTGRAGKTANLDVTRALQNIASGEQGQRISAATNPVLTRNLNALSAEGSFRPDTAMYRRMQRYNASPNWDNLMLVQASDMLSDSREGAPAMIASWNEGQNVVQYAREFTQYYNAGVRGSDINEVGDISRQVLTQDQRETAYLSGVRDAAAVSRQENSAENLQSNTENQSYSVEIEENTAENAASGSGSIADPDRIEQEVRRSDEEWVQKLEDYEASPNWNNDRLNDYANVILDNGAGTSGYMTMVGDWNEGQNEGRYAQEFTSYYNAGIQGSDISAVGNIANQILTQQQREDAYIAGRHDALTGAVKEAISEFEEAGSQVLSEEGNGGSDLGKGVSAWKGADRKGEAQRIARQQRNEAARIRTDAETEGLRSVSADELNIPNGTIGKTMKVIPESSSLYTNDMRRIADRMKRLGKEVRFFIGEIECFDPWTRESFRSNGATFGNEVWVRADDETFRAEDIAKHEEYHILKANYKEIQEEIAHAIIRNHDEAELNRLMRAYARDYKGLSADDILEEICADAYAGMERYYLWSEGTQGATQYTEEAQEAGERYYEQMAGSNEENQMENRDNNGVKHSLQTLPDGTKYVLLDGNIFLREDGTEMTPREAYRWLVNNKQQIRTEDGEIIDFATGLPNISTMAELFKAYPFVRGFQTDKKALNTLLNKNIIEVFEFSRGLSREIEDRSARHNKMGIKTFDTRHLIVSDGANAYDLELTVANLKDGRKIAYKKTFISLNKDVTEQIQKAPTRVPNPRVPSADNRISSAEQSVNTTETKFSISSDSEGRQLSEAQQEYFKDSKIRDEDGNLRVVYHGTDQEFTVFDRTKGRANMDIQGMFFSPWDIDAGGYGSNVKEYYLNITNPASESVGYAALNRFKGQNNAGIKAREYLEKQGYDGVNNGDEEYIAFRPEQIKLVSNTEPTSSPDIRFSRNMREEDAATINDTVENVNVTVDAETESVAPTDIHFSRNSFLRSEWVTNREQSAKELAAAMGVSVKKARDYIDQINSVAKMIADDAVRLDYKSHPGLSSFIGNVEYGGSFDFSTLCKKRRLMTGTFQMIQKALPNTALTPMDVLKIRQMMKDAGMEVSCGLCYVEGSRANMGQFTKSFIDLYKKYNPGKWAPTIAEIITPDGQEVIRTEHPEVYSEWEYFWNHHGQLRDGDPNLFASQQKPKLYQLRTEYNGEILDNFKKDSTIEQKNLNGGVRFQSFSDFEIVHLIDMMQIIMDMSKVGLAGQAYTKVPDFALALGNTGLKINLSLITKGLDENGQLIFDDVEGMPHDEAFRIRDMYSKNVGTILVTYTDDQLYAAMADDRIDFIIPFHRSQWKKSQYAAMGLPANTKDYTYQQNEKYIKPQYHEYRGRQVLDKAKNYMPNEYWDFSKSGKENAEAYLRMCAENNKRPKFYKFLQNNGDGSYSLKADGSTDGYWKLLIDFKMYDNDGKGSRQTAVRPDFNMNEATRMLNEYKGGHEQFPGASGIAEQFVNEYKEEHAGQKFSRSSRYSQETQREIQQERMDLELKLMQTAELLKEANKEKKRLQDQLTEAQRNMQLSKEKRALESNVQRAAAKLLKSYDVYPDDRNKYDDIHYELSKSLEQMRNIVLNMTDPEEYERKLRRKAIVLTDKIINGMKRLKDADLGTYQQVRDYLRAKPGITISEKDRADMIDYNAFRKRNMGRINLTNKGIPVDTAYQELQTMFGEGYFPSDITHPADQLFRIEEVMQTLEPVYENFNSYEIAEMKEYMASDIENEILDIVMGDAIKSVPPTAADKIAAQYESKIAGMKNFDERLSEMQTNNMRIIGRIVDEEREYRKQTRQKVREYYRELDAARREKRSDSDARTRLLKIARRLSNKKLPTPNKAVIQQYIGDLDLVSKSITGRTLANLMDLKSTYDSMKGPDFVPDPNIEAKLERLSRWRVNELSINEVRDLIIVLQNIETEIRNQGRLIEEEDRRQVAIMAEEIVRDVGQTKGTKNIITKKDDPDDANKLLKKVNPRNLDDLFVMGTLSPERAVRRMTGYNDSDPLYKATKSLSAGQRKMLDFQMRANKMFSEWMDDKKFMESISGKKAKLIEIRPGVKITPDMRMSLYLRLKNDDNLRHITRGGITLPNMALYKRGDMQEAYNFNDKDLMKNKIILKKSEIEQIVSGMSEKEKAFADEAAKYFGEMSQKAINETSNLLKGYSLAEVKNYFPINTDRNFTMTDFEAIKQDGTIEGMGFLKERIQASNPIYLRDMTDVLKQSIEMTGKYVGLAIPVRNFYKLWGAVLRERDPNTGQILSPQPKGSVKEAISTRWGDPGLKYIENMIADMQNRRTDTQAWSKIFRKLRSNYARGVLELNASVAMKQAASYPTAAAVLGWKPILQALKDVKRVKPELIDEYTPLLNYRKKGYSVQEIGDIKQQGMKLPKALSWITATDVATTTKLWKASEYYVRDNQKNLEVGSEDYYKAVAEIYNRVIEETQPNYTTMQRPGVLRQTDSLVSSLLMFKTQPFQNFNIVYDAIANWRAKEQQYKLNTNAETEAELKAARRDASNAITSQIGQLIVFAGMTFAWAMFRGKKEKYEDKDGEMTFGSVMKALGKDMAGNALSGIPFGSDAWEYLSSWVFKDKYYGFDVSTASALSDLTSALTKAKDSVTDISKTVFSKDADLSDINWREKRLELQDVVYGTAKVFGVPIENVDKLLSAMFRYASGAAVGNLKGEYAYLILTESETTSNGGINKKYTNLLFKSYRKDPELYEKIYYDLEKIVGSEKIKKAMENQMKEEQGVNEVSELEQRFLAPDQQAAYDAMLDPIEKSGLLSQASEKVEDKALARLYEIAKESTTGQEYQGKMDALEKKGIDNSTWLLYQLARDIADEQSDGNGYVNNEEKEAAIRMLNLTRKQSYELWQSDSKASTDANNPWK